MSHCCQYRLKLNPGLVTLYDMQQQHQFNGPLSRTTRVGWYQKGKTNLDFTEARDSEWQWHQLGHMQICTSPQSHNWWDALPAAQPTASKHSTT